MPIVTPCINLPGRCQEAIAVYEEAFGATTKLLLRYADADSRDWDSPLTDHQSDMVYHDRFGIRWGLMTEQTET